MSLPNCNMGRIGFTCKNGSKESSKWAETLYFGSLGKVGFANKISRLKLDCLLCLNIEKFEHQLLKKLVILGMKI